MFNVVSNSLILLRIPGHSSKAGMSRVYRLHAGVRHRAYKHTQLANPRAGAGPPVRCSSVSLIPVPSPASAATSRTFGTVARARVRRDGPERDREGGGFSAGRARVTATASTVMPATQEQPGQESAC